MCYNIGVPAGQVKARCFPACGTGQNKKGSKTMINEIDKEVAKFAALYVIDNAETLGIRVKDVPHGPHLRPAPYFAGIIH